MIALQIDDDFCPYILALGHEIVLGEMKSGIRLRRVSAEKCLEKITEIAGAGRTLPGAAEVKTRIPFGGWFEILACLPVAAEAVIGLPLFRIMKDFVGFTYLLESFLRVGISIDIRMEFSRQPPVRPFYVVLTGIFFTPEDLIIVLELHLFTLARHVIFKERSMIRWLYDPDAGYRKL